MDGSPTDAPLSVEEQVLRGREALARHAWGEAYELMRAADARGSLLPPDLELLAEASWWTGHLPEAIEVREPPDGPRRIYLAASCGSTESRSPWRWRA